MNKIKKIFHLLKNNPYMYFIIIIFYGWIVYRYFTIPSELPEEFKSPPMNKTLGSVKIESGMYQKAKNYKINKCYEGNKQNEADFCKVGWYFYGYINLLEIYYLPAQKLSPQIKKLFNTIDVTQALALGGALKYLNISINQVPIDAIWLPYVREGYGFFATYMMFRERFNYPLSTMCPSDIDIKYCSFGVGQAAYYVGYSKEEIGFNEYAAKGAEFAAVYGDTYRPEKPTPAEKLALALLNREKDPKNKMLKCLEKKHTLDCIN